MKNHIVIPSNVFPVVVSATTSSASSSVGATAFSSATAAFYALQPYNEKAATIVIFNTITTIHNNVFDIFLIFFSPPLLCYRFKKLATLSYPDTLFNKQPPFLIMNRTHFQWYQQAYIIGYYFHS